MERKNIKDLVIFIILVILIIGLILYNLLITKVNDVDRKIKYVNNYTYDQVLNKGKELYNNGINLLINKDIYEYNMTSYKLNYFSFIKDNKNYDNYLKIENFVLPKTTFNDISLVDYMNDLNIVYYKDNYYIKNKPNINSNLVGSILEIKDYKNNDVYFKLTNYYCDNKEFIGYLDKEPDCNYTKKETILTYEIIDNFMRISNYEELKEIL